jgi:UDP-N-acetylglucosamine 4,6-dehydratase
VEERELENLKEENQELKQELEKIKCLKENQTRIFQGKNILVTGGTGSFGRKLIKYLLENCSPNKIVIFSRDEMKQWLMAEEYQNKEILKFVIGDIRDKERLNTACKDIDYIMHAAALKIVPSSEENPGEAIKTNVLGAMNIINVSIENKVKKVIALSTDKACNPINLYGATKLCSDKLIVAANAYSHYSGTSFSVVRYGNVVGSRGSVLPFFLTKKESGAIPITDERMTRFMIKLEQGVEFVIKSFERMKGGEIFVPKIPSTKIVDLARVVGPECELKYIGIRPGEKLHESMISADDSRNTLEFEDYYIIKPDFEWWKESNHLGGKPVSPGFSYGSETNPNFLSMEQLKELVDEYIDSQNTPNPKKKF